MHTDPAVISLATAPYERVGFRGTHRFWHHGEFPAGCPDQLEVPFAFKPFCLAAAGAEGLRFVLWLDATCVAIRPLDPIFDEISARGYVLYRHVFKLAEWASDVTLAAYRRLERTTGGSRRRL